MRSILSALLMIAIILSTLAMTTACDEEGETTSANPVQENSQQNTTPSGDGNSANEMPLLVDAEIINGKLILFYSDGTTKKSDIVIDVDKGDKHQTQFPISASVLSFYPLNDHSYAVTMRTDEQSCNAINPYLQSITIPGAYNGVPVTVILSSAFFDSNITSVVISNGIVEIGAGAFSGAEIESVVLPDSLTTIGASAFSMCPLTKITIPKSVTQIDAYAFSECNKLTNITYEGTKNEWESIVLGENSFGYHQYGAFQGYTIHCSDGDIVVEP